MWSSLLRVAAAAPTVTIMIISLSRPTLADTYSSEVLARQLWHDADLAVTQSALARLHQAESAALPVGAVGEYLSEGGSYPWYETQECIEHPTIRVNGMIDGLLDQYIHFTKVVTKVFRDPRLTEDIAKSIWFNQEAFIPMECCEDIDTFAQTISTPLSEAYWTPFPELVLYVRAMKGERAAFHERLRIEQHKASAPIFMPN